MANARSLRSWDAMWEKLQRLLGFSGVESPFGRDTNPVIDEALTLYVETTGNDTNPGTKFKPFATIQAALESLVGKRIEAAVTVKVGLGNFAGFFTPSGLTIGQLGSLKIEGTLVVVDSGSVTTFSQVDGFFNIADSTKSWTADQHVGRFVRWTHSTGDVIVRPIGTNSSTQISLASNLASFGAGRYAYEIVEQGTKITSLAASSTASAIVVGNVDGARIVASALTIKWLETTAQVSLRWSSYLTLESCRLFSVSPSNCSYLFVLGCCLMGGSIPLSMSAATVPNSMVALNQTVIVGAASGNAALIIGNGGTGVSFSICQIRCAGGTSTGLNVIAGDVNITLVGVWNAATAVRAHQQATLTSGSTISTSAPRFVGSGNTLAIDCTKGSKVAVSSDSTITGTTELSVDGATSTIAAMRASSPKVFPTTPNAYGSYVYE